MLKWFFCSVANDCPFVSFLLLVSSYSGNSICGKSSIEKPVPCAGINRWTSSAISLRFRMATSRLYQFFKPAIGSSKLLIGSCHETKNQRNDISVISRRKNGFVLISYLEKLFNVLQQKQATIAQIRLTGWIDTMAGHIHIIKYTTFLHFDFVFAWQILAQRIDHIPLFTAQWVENQNAWSATTTTARE